VARFPLLVVVLVAFVFSPLAVTVQGELSPEESEYLGRVMVIGSVVGDAFADISALMNEGAISDLRWQNDMIGEAAVLSAMHEALQGIQPPDRYAGSHAKLLAALESSDTAGAQLRLAVENLDDAAIVTAVQATAEANAAVQRAAEAVQADLGGEGSVQAVATNGRCEPVPPDVVAGIEEGLTMTGGTLRGAQAVRSGDFEQVWFVAADIQAAGLEGNSDIAVWAMNDISAPGAGLTIAVNGIAKEFSDWGAADQSDRFTPDDDGIAEAEQCVAKGLSEESADSSAQDAERRAEAPDGLNQIPPFDWSLHAQQLLETDELRVWTDSRYQLEALASRVDNEAVRQDVAQLIEETRPVLTQPVMHEADEITKRLNRRIGLLIRDGAITP
jgi:hypothetical protein